MKAQPIRRSAELTPFSREHHDGLLLVWKIRQGISRKVEAGRISAYIRWFWDHHLAAHFRNEEMLLPPVLGADHEMIRQMMEEHERIRTLLNALGDDYARAEELAAALHDHIRFEERKLFGEIERNASPAMLREIGEALEEGVSCPDWEDPFWER